MRRRRFAIILSVLAVLLLALIAALTLGRFALRSFFYPKPGRMPPVVSETTGELLTRLQRTLEKRAPKALQSLQPGLSAKEISALETKGGFTLSDDLRALYQWRNGSKISEAAELIPGHRFVPLDEVVAERAVLLGSASTGQRVFFDIFAGHRKAWVHVLDDGAGDGYFHDPGRPGAAGGEFFWHFAETGSYFYFPSLRNFLKGVLAYYEQGGSTDRKSTQAPEMEKQFELWAREGLSDETGASN